MGAMIREAVEARRAAREIASQAHVVTILDRLGREVTAALSRTCPVVLAVMHGGVFTAVELARRLDFPHEFDYVHLSRYRKSLSGGAVDWIVRPRTDLRDRVVLVVDDVLDRGETLGALVDELRGIGVGKLHTAVLVAKELDEPRPRPAVDFVGITVGDCYVFGCGMDYKGFWRGLPALYALE